MSETDKSRMEIGAEMLKKINKDSADSIMNSLGDIAPDVAKFILEFAFSDIYTREGLTLQQRELVTITALLVQGDTSSQLTVHLNACLNVGLTKKEIIEAIIQSIPYVGFPKVLNAITVAKSVFAERNEVK